MSTDGSGCYEDFEVLLKKQLEILRLVDRYHGEKKIELLQELAQVESELYAYRNREDFMRRFVRENDTIA